MKRLMLSLIVVLAIAVASSGCFHNKVVTSPDYDPGQTVPDHEEMRLHLFQLIPLNSAVNLSEVCPGGAGVVETRYLIGLQWIGIPIDISQARVHCVPGGAEADVESPAEQLANN